MTGKMHGMAQQLPHQQQPVGNPATKCFLCLGCLSLIPASFISDMIFQGNPVAFTAVLKTYTDRSVVLDPGIPKRIT